MKQLITLKKVAVIFLLSLFTFPIQPNSTSNAISCELENGLKSGGNGKDVHINFANQLSEKVTIYWIDYAGKHVPYLELEPNTAYKQPSYSGHIWIIKNQDGKCISIHKLKDRDEEVAIGGDEQKTESGDDGKKIIKSYIGYMNKEETVTDDLSIFVSYGEEYRPSGFELERISLKIGNDAYPAYKTKISFSNNAKENVEQYGGNESFKFLYKVKQNTDYNLYFYKNGFFKLAKEYKAKDIQSGKINLHSSLNLFERGKPGASIEKPIFVVIPANQSSNVLAAEIVNENSSKPKELELKYISLPGVPYDTDSEDQFGPSTYQIQYGDNRPKIVVFKNADGSLCLGWKENDKDNFHFTELDTNLEFKKDIPIKMKFPLFGGFTKDEEGNYYIVFAKENKDGDFSSNVLLVKYNPSGKEIATFKLPTDSENFDTMLPISGATSRVVYGNGMVAVHMGKTQHKNKNDGANHQWAILFAVDSKTMKLNKDLSHTWITSHSFDQRTIFDGTDFVTLDLGDSYPRGFNLNKQKVSKVIFTYRTNPKIYQFTYSELGGLALDKSGYVVLGSSEKLFENNETIDSRNLFMLLVAHDFPSKKVLSEEGKEQPLMASPEVVISNGKSSKRITKYGENNIQQRVGVVWLTNYDNTDTENVCRPKLIKLEDNSYIAVWEKWTKDSYDSTYYLIFNSSGKVIKKATPLGYYRLNRGDDAIEWNGKALWVTGQKAYKTLKIHILEK